MANEPTDQQHLLELARLIAPGILGFYTHFEVTEVFAKRDTAPDTFNVFTIAVAENRTTVALHAPVILNPKPIRLKSLPGWIFGIERYARPIVDLVPALEQLGKEGKWLPSGQALNFGAVIALPGQFVPADAVKSVPLNHVLKNNFWSGSHLFEWADRKKDALKPLLDDAPLLQALATEVRKYVPIGLDALSDRLGNLLVQLPVTVLVSAFEQHRDSDDFNVKIAWHPEATPRPLRAMCELEFDGTISGYGSVPVQGPETVLPMSAGSGPYRGIIWDDAHNIVLAATGTSGFIRSVALSIRPVDPEPRTFSIKQKDGTLKAVQVGVAHTTKSIVGKLQDENDGGWTKMRLYKEQADQLKKERRFIQYMPNTGSPDARHLEALADLRFLINRHGEKAVWLWDPYLTTTAVMETLFYCPHSGSDLRALTSSKVPDALQQKPEFDAIQSNWRGLRIEFRISRGQAGWSFHDRFLIFPKADEGALAWSLGTSVQNVGEEHHILQRVDDGQLVADAFLDLWNRLDQPEHLIAKK